MEGIAYGRDGESLKPLNQSSRMKSSAEGCATGICRRALHMRNRFATLWGEIGGFGVLYLQEKSNYGKYIESTEPPRRGLKFDQEWKDAVDRLPKHYRDEICAAIEAYQRDLTVIEVSEGVPAPSSCSSCPRYAAAIVPVRLRRLARDRKAASQSRRQEAEQRPSIVRNISAQPSPAMQPKPECSLTL